VRLLVRDLPESSKTWVEKATERPKQRSTDTSRHLLESWRHSADSVNHREAADPAASS
jgi:hypothetical protein